MYPFRRAPEAQGEHVIWRSSDTAIIPDDVIDPQLLAVSNQSDAADQPSLPQQPSQLLPAESGQGNTVEQTSVYQHPPLDVQQSNHHVSLPPRDGSVHQRQPFSPSSLAYSPPQDGRVFFQQQQAAASSSLPVHPNRMSQGDTPAAPFPRTPHLNRGSCVRANVQSPVKSKSPSFSRGFGQGPMSEADEGPFKFQDEADSSPLSSLTATPARPSGPDSTDMEMDLDDWEPGREAPVGIPSSSPPRNNVTPQRPRQRQEEDLQGREGQYQRPRRYSIDLLLERVTVAPVADMEIEQGVAEGATASRAASHVDMESTSDDLSLQRPASQENASLEIVTPPRGSILRRFGPASGLSFPSGVPYSSRYSDYTRPPQDFSRPLGAASAEPPAQDLAAERGQPLSADGRTRIVNVSGPQDGESSRHGQHLDPQVPGPSTSSSAVPQVGKVYHPHIPSHNSNTEGVMQQMKTATPGPSASASNAPNNPQPATSGRKHTALSQGALQEALVKEVVEAADAILAQRRGPPHRQHLRPLAPKPPMQTEDTSPPTPHHAAAQQNTPSNDQTQPQTHQPRFTNMDQFQPLLAPPPPIQHPLLVCPFPLRIPGTFTPALLSLAINPPRSLQLGTPDSLQSYLRACGMIPSNDLYPRTFPVPVRREPFNRTVIVQARYLSVIGLLYPRAEFIVSRIAEEGAEEQKKVEPNSGVMMDKWHVYKAVRMSGEEMQKLGVCVWSEKGCREWEPVVEVEARVKKMEVVVDDDDDDEEEEEESDDTGVVSGKARGPGSGKEGWKENVRQTVEEEEEEEGEEECKDMEMEEAQISTTKTNKKEKVKDTQPQVTCTDKKDTEGKEVLQVTDGSGNAAGPSTSLPLVSASTPAGPPRRSTRVQSRQASVSDKDEHKEPAPPPNPSTIITRKLRAIQLDEAGLTVSTSTSMSRPIKTPKPRLTTTRTTTTKAIHPVTDPYPYLHESTTHYLITLLQRDFPSGGVARIQCTPHARQTIESLQDAFGILHPYEVWLQKDYRVWNGDTGKVKRRYIKVMRGYAGDEDTEEGMMRLFLDEREEKMKGKKAAAAAKKRKEKEKGKGKGKAKGKEKDGEEEGKEEEEEEEEESGDRGRKDMDMSRLEERKAWKEGYMALKRKGKRAVARAKGKRKEGEDMDMDYDEWLEERHEQEDELVERWFAEREGLVEEEEHARKTVEFAMFEYGGGDGLGLGKA